MVGISIGFFPGVASRGTARFQSAHGPKTLLYSGLFLTPDNFLKQVAIPEGWKRYAHHCTVEFKPTTHRMPDFKGQLSVTEIRKTDEVMYAVVDPPGNVKQWVASQHLPSVPWHVTIATAPGIKPFRAKEMAEQNKGEVVATFNPPQTLTFEAGDYDGTEILHTPS